MGTRNLTMVISKGKTKVAQYGQWDGYPTGQGQTIVDFLKTVDLEKFKKQVDSLGEYTKKDFEDANKFAETDGSGWVNMEQAKKINDFLPGISRDYGAGILELIHNGSVTRVNLQEDFKEDTLFCEYYYTIDLDKETVSMNGGKEYTFKQWTRGGLMEKLEQKESEV